MATVIFYEKPGCVNNTKQKALLKAAGHEVIAKNLLTETWTSDLLLNFFNGYLVSEWFNRSAPKIKSGDIIPEQIQANEAIKLMIAEPLLIRRPLIKVDNEYFLGFDPNTLQHRLQVNFDKQPDLETCHRDQQPCVAVSQMASER
jgi:nitrogenase-associated protein